MSKIRKKVLFFTPGTVGGAERVTATIARSLPKEEFDVKVVIIGKEDGMLSDFLTGITIDRLKWKSLKDFPTFRMLKYLLKERPDAVFSSLQVLNVRLPLAARIAGVKKVVVRNDIGWSSWAEINRKIAKWTLRLATDVICQTEEMKNEFQTALPGMKRQIVCIPNPLDIETIERNLEDEDNPLTEGKINYVYAGRIAPNKGTDTLIKAFRKVAENIPTAHLHIVGDQYYLPNYYSELQSLIDKLRLKNRISFCGFQSNPYKFIRHASCFVLPSRREGNPNVLHEALYLGVPAVATRSVPIVDRILTPEFGYVVDVDDIDALAEAMISAKDFQRETAYDYRGGKEEFTNLFRGNKQHLMNQQITPPKKNHMQRSE